MREQQDPYLKHVSDIEVPLGMTAHDAARVSPGPKIVRTFELLADSEEKDFPKSADHILAKGAACGLDETGQCSHLSPDFPTFCGFLEGSTADRATLKTRGSVILQIEGAEDERHRGEPVFCYGPSDFTLDQVRGSVEIGRIRFVQDGRVAVAFKRFDDSRPLNLSLR